MPECRVQGWGDGDGDGRRRHGEPGPWPVRSMADVYLSRGMPYCAAALRSRSGGTGRAASEDVIL
ncbi:hypothetical protein Y601_5135 [Burkholderia pseudomallei MSHR640]|nr:hypothetical protein Y601_5135 [Burkholderia pseudomallei MSHR640]